MFAQTEVGYAEQMKPSAVRKSSPVEQSVGNLERELIMLSEVVERLCRRLEPLRQPMPADCERGVEPIPSSSPFVNQLYILTKAAERQRTSIQMLLEELEF